MTATSPTPSRIETHSFAWQDPAARAFLADHGYVVVREVLAPAERAAIAEGWDAVVGDAAARIGLRPTELVERFPQNRDLWRKHVRFERLLFDARQGEVARTLLGVSGVRLFHDHAICKPARSSGEIPWHQDSAYWPLDRVGLSLWTPTDDVDGDGGCLEVLAGSHRDGPGAPQDFLAGRSPIADDDPRRVLLPVTAGATVALNGLTWHRSAVNRSRRDRLAYLTLWVPSSACFVPEHAGWHPTAAHIAVRPGERLDGEWFPLFGELPRGEEGEAVRFPVPERGTGPSMFTAGRDIAAQLGWLAGRPEVTLAAIFAACSADELALRAVARGIVTTGEAAELRDLLEALELQDRVRRESVARDVYLRTVERWWTLIGARIEEARRAG
jgi:ectoine hydroxylase-related dioxygenase (phytanoyl-CoA dioxygenase family)